ncbi:MAG TPA: alkaline phosphatase family protein, partial [Planctomycetota bacterium]|nr:alkaline phosphatase family protein [Planctomycetota bacterium]
ALALLLAACGPSAPAPAPGPAAEAVPGERSPAVEAALKARPDLAKSRVFLLGLDGCDPVLVEDLVRQGRLPNFKRLKEEGAFGPLRSQEPMLSPLLWTTIATGKWPTEHGVLDFMIADPDDPKNRVTVEGRNRQVEAMWDIVGRYGSKVGVVGWLATHPAEKVNGFAISDRAEPLAYLLRQKPDPSIEGVTWPTGLHAELAPQRKDPKEITFAEAAAFVRMDEADWRSACRDDRFSSENRVNNLRLILAASENFRRVSLHLWKKERPRLQCSYFQILDAVCHNTMGFRAPLTWKPREPKEVADLMLERFARMDRALVESVAAWMKEGGQGTPPRGSDRLDPNHLRWIAEMARGADADRVARLGGAVDAAYDWADRLLGEVMASLDADTTLVVVSDHGWIGSPSDELDRKGKPIAFPGWLRPKAPFDASFDGWLSGGPCHRGIGVLGLFGAGVRKGHEIPTPRPPGLPPLVGQGARIHDIAPTVLALLGFPKGDDMPGRVLAEAFEINLVTGTVPTHETGRAARLARERVDRETRKALASADDPGERDPLEDSMREMASVGYIGGAEDADLRKMLHLAESYLEQQRFQEAEEAFVSALGQAREQQKALLLVRLGALRRRAQDPAGAKGRYEEALKVRADFVPALVGLAQLADDGDDRSAAVAGWERVLAAEPQGGASEGKVRLANALRERWEASRGSKEDLERALKLVLEAVAEARARGDGEEQAPGAPEDPGNGLTTTGRNMFGMLLLRTGRLPAAMAQFERAAAREPSYLQPRTNLGVLHLTAAAGALKEAELAKDAATREKMLENAAQHRAQAMRRLGEVLAVNPNHHKALYNRAEVHLNLLPQDTAAAARDLEAALKAQPRYRRAQELLSRIRGESQGPPK